jgi:lysophospholipase L1-like esterase
LAGGLVVASLALAACGGPTTHIRPDTRGPHAAEWKGKRYVALGDSYTAGPGIGGSTAVTGPEACQQSDENYPHLVAARLEMTLHDVSCSGAQTAQMTRPERRNGERMPPQFDALSSATDLVTVGIGANDNRVFMKLISGCVFLATSRPHGSPCRTALLGAGVTVHRYQRALTRHLVRVFRGIARRAPHARILAIGYPQVVPAHGHCSELPLATGDYRLARAVNIAFNEAMRTAAERRGITYVDVWDATEGHDICSTSPWIAGSSPGRAGAAYHPYADEMQAVAVEVVKVLAG